MDAHYQDSKNRQKLFLKNESNFPKPSDSWLLLLSTALKPPEALSETGDGIGFSDACWSVLTTVGLGGTGPESGGEGFSFMTLTYSVIEREWIKSWAIG